MKVFAIRDEEDKSCKNIAYLIYYEKDKRFYIELPDEADPWETPLVLSSFAKRGEYTINAYWSRLWVQQRIIPPERQNIGQILKANRLNDYDEYAMLMLGEGRCAQDSYYLFALPENILSDIFRDRFARKIVEVVPLDNAQILVVFQNGETKKCDMKKMLELVVCNKLKRGCCTRD